VPKVMFCTTENDFSFIEQALAAGANEYIMKPFDKEIVQGKLDQIGAL
jgi:two-component system chemotaxis response regulator CheY